MNKPFEGKKIILAVPHHAKIYECLEDNLVFLGFTVFRVVFTKEFKFKNIYQRIRHIYRKFVDKNRLYKKSLIIAHYDNLLDQMLVGVNHCDYSLTIRADIFSKSSIEKITSLADKNYSYHWDGLNRYASVVELIDMFDKFYVFDKNDVCETENKHPLTNFYFDCYPDLQTNTNTEYDIYFIANQDVRLSKLMFLCKLLMQKNRTLKILLMAKFKKRKILPKYGFISYLKLPISYKQNLVLMSKAKIVIDLIDKSIHNGLSFRPFEALGYNKKLITNNPTIKEYDFYHPSNVFFYDPNNFDILAFDEFLNADFVQIDSEIKLKYGFTSWIMQVLEIDKS